MKNTIRYIAFGLSALMVSGMATAQEELQAPPLTIVKLQKASLILISGSANGTSTQLAPTNSAGPTRLPRQNPDA